IAAVDDSGQPVVVVEALSSRPVEVDRIRQASQFAGSDLFRVDWVPAPAQRTSTVGVEIFRCRPSDGDLVEDVHAVTSEVLHVLQSSTATKMAIVIKAQDLAHAAVRGLVRSAQSEEPHRFILVDLHDDDESMLDAAIGSGEPQIAVRAGALYVPRLTP